MFVRRAPHYSNSQIDQVTFTSWAVTCIATETTKNVLRPLSSGYVSVWTRVDMQICTCAWNGYLGCSLLITLCGLNGYIDIYYIFIKLKISSYLRRCVYILLVSVNISITNTANVIHLVNWSSNFNSTFRKGRFPSDCKLDAKLYSVQVVKESLQSMDWTCGTHVGDVLLPEPPPCMLPAVTFASTLHHFSLPVSVF